MAPAPGNSGNSLRVRVSGARRVPILGEACDELRGQHRTIRPIGFHQNYDASIDDTPPYMYSVPRAEYTGRIDASSILVPNFRRTQASTGNGQRPLTLCGWQPSASAGVDGVHPWAHCGTVLGEDTRCASLFMIRRRVRISNTRELRLYLSTCMYAVLYGVQSTEYRLVIT